MTATVTTAIKQWKTLKVGAGGWCTGFDQHADGTLVIWSDVNGPWLWNGASWDLLINTSSMPASELHIDNHSGVVSVAIAPSNSNIFYMFYYGNIFKSSNKGTTWTLCAGWTRLADARSSSNAQTAQRYSGPLMAVDPANANVLYVGTQDDGLFRTLNAGTTFTVRTDVPVGTGTDGDGHAGVNGILFDPLSATTTVSGVTTTANVWAASRGDGYYTSTDGGTTWTRPTGGPTTCVNRARFHGNGTLWCSSYGPAPNELWRFPSGGSWEQITASVTGQGAHAISCDPYNDDRIIVSSLGGTLQESLNCNAATPTFSTLWFGVVTNSSPEIPWFEMAYSAGGSPFMSNGDMRFHPTTQNKLMFSDGIGFWTTTLAPSFNTITWTSMSKGIENIVAQQVTAAPNGRIHLSCQDRMIYTRGDPDAYPDEYFLNPRTVTSGQSVDYCFQNSDIVCASGLEDYAGYSLDGGTTWTQFTGFPATWPTPFQAGYGQIVPLSATQFIWWPASNLQPYRTSDAGANWTAITITGIDNDQSATGWPLFGNGSRFSHRDILAQDGVTAGTVYAWACYNKGVYKSTDYGANWSSVFSGAVISNAFYQTGFKGVEGKAGHLWATAGKSTTSDALGYVNYADAPVGAFKRSVDGGVTWVTVNTNDVKEVYAFGFGKAATGAAYPTLFIIGYVNAVFGIYYSTDATDAPSDPDVLTWTKISDEFPMGQLCNPNQIDGDKLSFGRAYIGAGTNGFMYTEGIQSGVWSFTTSKT